MKKKRLRQRVDIQVAILVAILVVCSSTIVFYFAYSLSYKQMIASLEDRVNSIALYIDKEIPSTIFADISEADDMNTVAYTYAHSFLSGIREIAGPQYLYTATKNKQGELIYHIDGLPEDSSDFRKPGDLIEADFQEDLEKALCGHIVMPDDIKNTEWGDVFVAYYPIHDATNNNVIGAIGLEFPANSQYQAFRNIRLFTPVVILLTCILAFFVSRNLFSRISNPHFKDLSNTDSLTGLKNRNAYDLDLENLIHTERIENYALVLCDLNALKAVNDQCGHKLGDEYIKHFAQALESQANDEHVSYRIGGDVFATFFFNPTQASVECFIHSIKHELKVRTDAVIPYCSVAAGYAFGQKLDYDDWEKTQAKADAALYKDKKAFYENNQKCDNRR